MSIDLGVVSAEAKQFVNNFGYRSQVIKLVGALDNARGSLI